jgi:aminoglycoside phosphotransferase (APT) family kinase protein
MAATPSPPSEAALARFLVEASGARAVEISGLELLAGGAIQQNWGFQAQFAGGALAGRHPLVLRTDAETGVPSSLGRVEEFAVLKAAYSAGVTVPEPLFACADPAVIRKPFFVTRRLPGTAQGRIITSDPALAPARPKIAARLGQELARIQTIRPPRRDLAFLPSPEESGPEVQFADFRAYLDRHPQPRPVLEWAIRWLETHIPAPLPPVLCHRDFRTGNYLLDGPELTGILDWEFAGWGDPDEDIGWFCCKGWRFARLDREAGGIADRAAFYRGYEAASGRRLEPKRIFFWEIFANLRWAIIALQQSDRHLLGGARDLSTAIIGRRAGECELELLMLLDPDGPPASCRPAGETSAVPHPWRDRPTGLELLELGRELLLDEVLPLLPESRHRELHLLATAIAIARRETQAGDALLVEALDCLAEFYQYPPAEPLLSRFAADLRNGAFETSRPRERDARAILWAMTIARLREGNPHFLAAHGFGD